MKIAIDISENIYNLITGGEENRDFVVKADLMRAIEKGKPLPVGHGKLIDVDHLLNVSLLHNRYRYGIEQRF